MRKIRRTPEIMSGELSDAMRLFLNQGNIDTKMMQHQSFDSVRKIVDLLPDEQREVIVLPHYADLSFRVIARLDNCSINSALGRIRYGAMNMRRLLVEKQIAL